MNSPADERERVLQKLIDNYVLLLEMRGEAWLKSAMVQYAERVVPPLPHPAAWADQVVASVRENDGSAFSRLFGPEMYRV